MLRKYIQIRKQDALWYQGYFFLLYFVLKLNNTASNYMWLARVLLVQFEALWLKPILKPSSTTDHHHQFAPNIKNRCFHIQFYSSLLSDFFKLSSHLVGEFEISPTPHPHPHSLAIITLLFASCIQKLTCTLWEYVYSIVYLTNPIGL